MSQETRSLLLRLFFALALGVLLVGGWNLPLIISVAKPQVISLAADQAKSSETEIPNLEDESFYYPQLGIKAPLQISRQTSPLVVQDWPTIEKALRQGVSLSFQAENFEETHFAFLTGHSSDVYPHKYSAIFASLGQGEAGDRFYLKTVGVLYIYQVTEKQILNPGDTSAFEKLEERVGEKLRIGLVTCWPPPTRNSRLVVLAELVEVQK